MDLGQLRHPSDLATPFLFRFFFCVQMALGLLVSDSALLFPKGSLLCHPSGPVCFETGETGSYYVAQAALKLASLNLIIGVGGTFLLKLKRHPLSSRLVIQLQVVINSLKPPAQRRSGVEKTGFPPEGWV